METEILRCQRFGLSPVHVTAVVTTVEMRHARHTVATPETLWVPRVGEDVITPGCHGATLIVVRARNGKRPSWWIAGMPSVDPYAVADG